MNSKRNIITDIKQEHPQILAELRHFLDTYDVVDDVVRITEISKIWTMIRNNEHYKLDLLYPLIREQPFIREQIRESELQFEDIDTQIEGMEMIHVDEPGHAFKVRSRELLDMVDVQYALDNHILDTLFEKLPEEDIRRLTKEIGDEKNVHQTTNY